ncbi:MAG: FHA domain-containing protein [Cyanobacteria bacterium]|jgi:WD40 repeat protein|nr:FHA domain-containing protein [Cyanobacteria bacterium GSL.Bin1]
MTKLVVLNLGTGNFNQGFPFVSVTFQSSNYMMQVTGNLPAVPKLLNYYQHWQSVYQLLNQSRSLGTRDSPPKDRQNPNFDRDSSIFINETDITHVSEIELSNAATQLKSCLDSWLNTEGFRQIERSLRQELSVHDEIRFIIQTSDQQSRQIPWSIWQFFQDYPGAEVALSALDFKSVRRVINPAKQVRILAILGNSSGINIEADRALLENLKGANVVFLVEPSRQKLDEYLWHQAGWDILFFAGHSCSQLDGKTGEIYINPTEKLTIAQLKNALNRALKSGLQLAIFNSCQGLGLANQLSDLDFPQMILMREPVPDRVAQIFLKHFLFAFSEGQSLYLAFREARERLQGIEGEFPGASWLPLIFQNPAEMPPTWNELSKGETTIMSNASSNFVATLTLHPSSPSPDCSKTQQYFLSSEEVTVIGRSPDCQIPLNPTEHVTVSRRHAEIKHIKQGQESGWHIRDTGTTNGTLVNDQRIEGWHSLNSGDRVTLGYKGPELIFEHSALPTTVFIPVSTTEESTSAEESISELDSQAVEEKKEAEAVEQNQEEQEASSALPVPTENLSIPEEKTSPSASQSSTKAPEKPTASVPLPSLETKEEITKTDKNHTPVKSTTTHPEPTHDLEAITSSSLWGIMSQREVSHLPCSEEITALAFSPDGATLASASGDKTIKLWNLETGEETLSITAHKLAINALAFSPDGATLASASGDKTIKLWNLETGEETLSITAHKLAINALAFSPDGATLASASGDKTIKLWNLETGEETLSMSTQKSIISALTFSPEKQLLASVSDRQWIKLWSIGTAEEILSMAIPTAYRGVTVVHPDGQTLASAVEGEKIALWTL